ncbi:MAG: phosphopantothenate--cysteine ligase [Clostridiales Family XIII bacterium]|jgi:phosphopantothenate-cysteine ligase|nr:phosphopantothenate--cysteine ligase [Clostridiales Family XIII bacterium]
MSIEERRRRTARMNILITAGGTTEKIDDVRGIANTGTGRLGALIAKRFADAREVERVFYVCSARAARPSDEKIEIIVADDTRSLERTIIDLCASRRVDAIIHSMAVSDYRVRTVSTSLEIGKSVAEKLRENDSARAQNDASDAASVPALIARAVTETPSIASGGKISSGLDDMVVVLERTPKIIALFRKLSPGAVLVGFKLLANASEETLMRAAYDLLKKNDCDCVLANDLRDIGEGKHIGRLIDAERTYTAHDGKEAIAEAIVRAVFASERLRGRDARQV